MENYCSKIENASQRPEYIHLGSRNRSKSPCFPSSNEQMNHSGSFVSKSHYNYLQNKQMISTQKQEPYVQSTVALQAIHANQNHHNRNLSRSYVDHSFRQNINKNILVNQRPLASIVHKHHRSPSNSIENKNKMVVISPRCPLQSINSPKNKPNFKYNVNSPLASSKYKQNTYSPVSISLGPHQIISNVSEREKQLLRKIKVLENRVAELHQTKKAGLMQLQLENQKLIKEMAVLKEDLHNKNNSCSERKVNPERNQQYIKELKTTIQVLKKQNQQLQAQRKNQQFSRNLQEQIEQIQNPKMNYDQQSKQKEISDIQISQINNFAYEDKIKEAVDNLTTQRVKNEQLNLQLAQLNEKSISYKNTLQAQEKIISQLKLEKQRIKGEFEVFKHEIIQSSKRIQENQKMIVRQFEAEIQQYKKQIQALTCRIGQQDEQHSLQANKSQQIDINAAKQQMEQVIESINKLQQENQRLLKQKDIYEIKINDLKRQLIKMEQEKNCIQESNRQLLERMQQLQNEKASLQLKMTQKSKCSSSSETCKKCQEMMRTVIKLNNYVNGKR